MRVPSDFQPRVYQHKTTHNTVYLVQNLNEANISAANLVRPFCSSRWCANAGELLGRYAE